MRIGNDIDWAELTPVPGCKSETNGVPISKAAGTYGGGGWVRDAGDTVAGASFSFSVIPLYLAGIGFPQQVRSLRRRNWNGSFVC